MKRAIIFRAMFAFTVAGVIFSGTPTAGSVSRSRQGSHHWLHLSAPEGIDRLSAGQPARAQLMAAPTPTPMAPTPTPGPPPNPAPRYVATTGTDAGDCSNNASPCRTIGYAIGQSAPGDKIHIDAGTYTESAGYANVVINKNVTLAGAGAGATIIDGVQGREGVMIGSGATVHISGVTITKAYGYVFDNGGGIDNSGTLTLVDSAITNNLPNGIVNYGGATLTAIGSTINNNGFRPGNDGGGILNFGTTTVINSTISGNFVGYAGGGIASQGQLMLINSTVTDNTSDSGVGGGVINWGTATLRNSIVAGNASGKDCYGGFTSQGYNLIGNNDGCTFAATTGDQVGISGSPIDPKLGPLQNNGGLIFTHMPLPGSPAIDAGNPTMPGSGNACESTDQLGTSRPQGGACDIGALEVFPVPAITGLTPSSATAGDTGFTLTIAGKDFFSGSHLQWNGAARPTTFVSSTEMRTQISAADVAAPGVASVTVVNPAPGGGASNNATFAINSAIGNSTPIIHSLSRSSATVGSDGFTLTIAGAYFAKGAQVRWNGAARPTTFVSGTEIQAQISRADLAVVGAISLTVANPAPGGGVSNVQPFTIERASVYLPQASVAPPVVGPPPCNDVEPANDVPKTAPPLKSVGQECLGSFDNAPADSNDLYQLVVATQKTISIDLTNIPVQDDYTLALYDGRLGGNERTPPLCVSKTAGQASEYIVYPNAAPGTYYIGIFVRSRSSIASNTYHLRVTWENKPASCVPPPR